MKAALIIIDSSMYVCMYVCVCKFKTYQRKQFSGKSYIELITLAAPHPILSPSHNHMPLSPSPNFLSLSSTDSVSSFLAIVYLLLDFVSHHKSPMLVLIQSLLFLLWYVFFLILFLSSQITHDCAGIPWVLCGPVMFVLNKLCSC